jgi:hypothetical protein
MARLRQRVDQVTSLHSESAFDQLGGFTRAFRHHRGNLERFRTASPSPWDWSERRQSDNRNGIVLACQRHGPIGEAPHLGGKIMNRDIRNVIRSPEQSWDGEVHLSPSELLSLLSSFHARLDAFFEEMRVFPEAAARQKTANSRSLTTEHDLPLVSASRCEWFAGNEAGNSSSRSQRAHTFADRPRRK